MCTELEGVSIFIYLATWCAILFYMTAPYRYMLQPTVLVVVNAVILCIHLNSDCHMAYIKTGAATEAVLLFVLCRNVSGTSTRNSRTTQTTGRNKTKTRDMEKATGRKEDKGTRES